MATQIPPLRATAYYIEVALISQADTDIFQNNPTLAAGDVVVYKDGALDGNIDTLPSAIGAGRVVAVTLSVAEMTADRVTVLFHDAAGDEWQDLLINIHTVTTNQIDDLSTFDATADTVDVGAISGDAAAANNLELDYDGTGYAKANSTIGTCTTNTDMRGTDNAALAATALSTATWTNARAGYLDELAAANLPADIAALPTATDNADALLRRDWTVVAAPAARSVLNALRFLRNRWRILAGVLTVYEEDDASAAWTATVDTAASDPVDEIDPA